MIVRVCFWSIHNDMVFYQPLSSVLSTTSSSTTSTSKYIYIYTYIHNIYSHETFYFNIEYL